MEVIYQKINTTAESGLVQRVANMARSRLLALCLLITRIFMFLLISLDSTEAAMGYICCYTQGIVSSLS